MQTDDVAVRFASLLAIGFDAVGCRIPVEADQGSVFVRDVIVEFGKEISCFRAGDPDRPYLTFPSDAAVAAATAVCAGILSGMVAREIERAAESS